MSSFIKLDSNNLVQNGLNNTFRIQFGGSSVNFMNNQLAVQSISLFNSEFNIDAEKFNNDTFSLEVPTGTSVSTISINLGNGYFSYSDINREIQRACVSLGAYLINADGDNVFYVQISENSVFYSCQLDVSLVPTSLPSGWSYAPSGLYSDASGLPTTSKTPRMIIDNEAFGKIIGFSVGEYPDMQYNVDNVFLSNIIPQVHPSSSYIVRCDAIENNFVPSADLLCAFDRGSAGIGQLITYTPSNYAWVKLFDGPRSTMQLSIWNQNDQPVHFRDTSISIMLLIR